VFSVKNSQVIHIDLWPLPFQFNLTLSLVILGCFAVGVLSGGLLVWLTHVFKRLFERKNKEET